MQPSEPMVEIAAEVLSKRPMVSVVIPTLNEERHIETCLASILATGYPADRFEVLIVDGGSSDRTVDIANALAVRFGNVRVLNNPGRIQAKALNIGIRCADPRSSLIIRADAHSIFPPDFVSLCVDAMHRHAADVVVFTAVPIDQGGCFQKAVACAQSTPLGVGNSHYRLNGISQPVEHGFHGCFRRAILNAVGLYDESFTHNEDGELSFRIRQAGGKIFLDHTIQVKYVPRETVGGLIRQYRAYGRGRARNVLKHRTWPRLRQIAPVGLVILELLLLALSPLALLHASAAVFPLALAGLLGIYLLLLALAGIGQAVSRRDPCVLMLPVALSLMHHTWGAGFVEQLASASRSKRCRVSRKSSYGESTL
jgi:succinoglycan biosynthesis protein ExoA